MRTYAFIDAQNLHLAITAKGWSIDYQKFYQFLADKYKVDKVFYFIGYKVVNEGLYQRLKRVGYEVVFKPVVANKGNCDSDLIVHCWRECSHYDRAVVISSDGDFLPLYMYLQEQGKLFKIGIPSKKSQSSLLKKFKPYFFQIEFLRQKIEYKVKKT
jgi:uncharacterized LabA/DUF88 family protein